jgi:hypothetical protein
MASIPDKEKGIPTKTGDEVFVKIIEKNRSLHSVKPGVMMWIVRTLSIPCGNPGPSNPYELFSGYQHLR